MTDRDYIAEMLQLIDEAIEEDDYIAAEVAMKLHARLAETDPDLLSGWLHARAVRVLVQEIRDRERATRQTSRNHAVRDFEERARQFAEAQDDEEREAAAVSLTRMSRAKHQVLVNGHRVWKFEGEMTGPEHRHVADKYAQGAARGRMLAAFHRAVAKKAGARKASEVFSDDSYEQLYRSITRGKAA